MIQTRDTPGRATITQTGWPRANMPAMPETRPTPSDDRPLTVGYLHLGDDRHGVRRYGAMIAAEVARRPGVSVIEESLVLSGDRRRDRNALTRAAERLEAADVIHLQHNRAIWGDGSHQLAMIREFLDVAVPPVVASLHDVYVDDPWEGWRQTRKGRRFGRLLDAWRTRVPTRRTLRVLLRRCHLVIVCFECERERLASLRRAGDDVRVIGHFVEARGELPDRADARRSLGIGDQRVVTLLGFIHRRKGADLLVEAMRFLPDDVLVVLAGAPSPGNDRMVVRLQRRAAELGAADRLRVTGFVTPQVQDQWLSATDLAVCPFRFLSASGSIATWISAGRPLLAFSLPQIDEYLRAAPGSFTTFDSYDAESFAQAIVDGLARGADATDGRAAVADLRDRFALSRMADQHLALYHEVAASRAYARHT